MNTQKLEAKLSSRTTALAAFVLLFLPIVPVAVAAFDCPTKFAQIDPAAKYAENSRKEIEQRSSALTASLKKKTAEGRPEKVNLVIVGGGPHSTELYSSYHSTNPKLKAVVFEATNEVGTFDRFGGSFSLNTPETQVGSGNPMYGSSIPLKAFNRENFTYLPADRMGYANTMAHQAAKTPLALGQQVTEVLERPPGANWPARYLVRTDDGILVYADAVVAATGTGTPRLGVTDAASLAFAAEEAGKSATAQAAGKTYVPLVETIDKTLTRAKSLANQDKNFLELYQPGERVAVIGSSQGSMVTVEALSGEAPSELYANGIRNRDVQIVWIGQKSANFADFKTANPNPRYWPTLEKVWGGGNLTTQPGRVVSWYATTGEEAKLGRVAVVLKDTPKPVYVDRIITSTGYANKADDLFQNLVPQARPDQANAIQHAIVKSVLDQKFSGAPIGAVPITEQLIVNGKEQDIYIAGQALGWDPGKNVDKSEFDAAIGGYLDVLGRRSEALGRDLALKAGDQSFKPLQLNAAASTAQAALTLPTTQVSKDAVSAEMDLLVSLQRAFYQVRLPPDQVSQFTIVPGASPTLTASGIDNESLKQLKSLIENDSNLAAAMETFLRTKSAPATISLAAKADGRPIFESLGVK